MSRLPVPIAHINRRLPEAGRIRTGAKTHTSNGKERPTALRQFRFTSHDEEALGQVANLYGGTVTPWAEPKAAPGQYELLTDATEIRVVLPPDPLGGTPIYERWTGGGCDRRCDGLTCTTTVSGPDGPEPTEVPCLCVAAGAMSCDVKVRLNVMLPEVRFAGTWRLESKSWNAAQELPGMVDMVQSLGQGLSHATLTLQPRKSIAGGQTKNFVIPVLGIPASLEQLAAGAARLQSLTQSRSEVAELGSGSSGGGEHLSEEAAPPPADTDSTETDDGIIDAEVIDAVTADGHVTGSDCSLCGRSYGDTPLVKGHQGESRFVHRDCRTVDQPIAESTQKRVFAELRKRGIGSPERHQWASVVLGREVTTFKEVSEADAARFLEWFDANPIPVVAS